MSERWPSRKAAKCRLHGPMRGKQKSTLRNVGPLPGKRSIHDTDMKPKMKRPCDAIWRSVCVQQSCHARSPRLNGTMHYISVKVSKKEGRKEKRKGKKEIHLIAPQCANDTGALFSHAFLIHPVTLSWSVCH